MTPNTITIPAQELKTVLPGLSKVLSRSSTLPVLRCLRFSRDEAGTVRLQATDLDSHLTCKMAGEYPGPAAAFLVPLEPLLRTVRSASSKEGIGFALESKERLLLRSVVSSTPIEEVLATQPLEDWPLAPALPGSPSPVDDYFKEALGEALRCISSESTRYILNGACLDTQDKAAHYMVGTDGRHLYAANSFSFPFKEPVIIPGRKFLLWPAFVEDGAWGVSIAKQSDTTWVQVVSNRWEFLTKAIEGNYPNWKQILPTEPIQASVRLTPEGSRRLVELLPRIPGHDSATRSLALLSDGKEFRLAGRNHVTEPFTQFLVPEATVSGAPFELFLDRAYWRKSLEMGLLEMEIRDNHGFLVCRSGRKKMVIAPVKGESTAAIAAPPSPAPTTEPTPAGAPSSEPKPALHPTESPANAPTEMQPTRTPMTPNQTPTTSATTTTEKPPRTTPPVPEPKTTAMERLLTHVEGIKTSLRQVMGELSETVTLLKAVERENRATEKEIEAVRSTLRSLQKVNI